LNNSGLEAKLTSGDAINPEDLLLSYLRYQSSLNRPLLNGKFGVLNYEMVSHYVRSIAIGQKNESIDLAAIEKTPLSLIFDSKDFSSEDIKNIISIISEIYFNIGGDYLKIAGMSQFEHKIDLDFA